uniref:Ig-like domain-containing protein n=1 Tax=Sander lucioperca TaxID=283035 RepID=A0A8C9ZVG7_SANLU
DMYFKIILILSGAVFIYAQSNYGCFDSSDTQLTVTLDGDEVYYADFKKGLLVWDSKIPTTVHVPLAYEIALHYRAVYCIHLAMFYLPPEIIIYPRDEVIEEEENTLICFINHFFPPSINIKWTKNDIDITVEDPFDKCINNPDGTFHVFSYLNFVPKEGDIYGCTVEHASLEKPQTKFWEADINQTSISPDIFCGLGLFLGLLGVAAGTFFFVKGKLIS